jgi:2-polyprenyl-3-methyl-5-hydroxy-6-metoxy-1,4-benzoquinol methylase
VRHFRSEGGTSFYIKDSFYGKKILDVGCGLGPDSVFYAEHGAAVTFLDIVPTNVEFVR